jgi:large subunit ribosomal protein L19
MSAGEETTSTETTKASVIPTKMIKLGEAIASISSSFVRSDIPEFNTGDSVRVHAKIIEGTKERIQIFEGVVIKRVSGNRPDATFTVRKVSYNIGVERTFPLHSPRIDKIELTSRAKVRRSRLFYLRPLRGKATRMKTLFEGGSKKVAESTQVA